MVFDMSITDKLLTPPMLVINDRPYVVVYEFTAPGKKPSWYCHRGVVVIRDCYSQLDLDYKIMEAFMAIHMGDRL